MNTKLTLTIEKEVIEIAKEYAKDKGQSLSEMVENYFKILTSAKRKINEKKRITLEFLPLILLNLTYLLLLFTQLSHLNNR